MKKQKRSVSLWPLIVVSCVSIIAVVTMAHHIDKITAERNDITLELRFQQALNQALVESCKSDWRSARYTR